MTQIQMKTLRERLWLFGGKRCHYCGKRTRLNCKPEATDRATKDHKIPVCRGGSRGEENQVSACLRCNNLKGVLTESEFRAMPMLDAIRFNDLVGETGQRMTDADALQPFPPTTNQRGSNDETAA